MQQLLTLATSIDGALSELGVTISINTDSAVVVGVVTTGIAVRWASYM